jgi:hypothetical protein
MRSMFWLASLLVAFPVSPQAPGAPSSVPSISPRLLSASGHIKTTVPMFGSPGNARCDSSGNYMFDAGSLMGNHGPYLKISSDGQRHFLFRLPQEVSGAYGIDLWTITPNGVLYVLHDDFQKNQLVRFKDDGTVENISSLALPPHVSINKIAVTENGISYVIGYKVTQKDQVTKPEPGFAAIYNADGKLIRDLSAETADYDLPGTMTRILDGDLIAGDDGRFYVLGDKEVRVVTQSGEVSAAWKVTKPQQDGMALRIDESKGTVSVAVYALRKGKQGWADTLRPTAFLYNSQTGDLRGTFTFDADLTGTILCYNAHDGYTLGAVDGAMKAFDIVPAQ